MSRSPRKSGEVLTPLELEIMQVLWAAGPLTVADVQEKLGAELAYTTVQTMLTVLLRKRKVKRTPAGRAFCYQAAVSREGAVGATLSDLVSRMFGGSAEALLMALVDSRQITAEQIARASELLARAEDDPAERGEAKP
ncbi:MAG: BlaI/MecI/CopY family transcriptional regulator [Caulobacteraceae bacterium]